MPQMTERLIDRVHDPETKSLETYEKEVFRQIAAERKEQEDLNRALMDSRILNERNTLTDIFMNSGGKYKDSIDTLVKTGYGTKPVETEEKECRRRRYPGVHQKQQQDKCGKHALMALTSTPETEERDEKILDQAITCTAGTANHMESDALVATTKRIGFDWYALKKGDNEYETVHALLEMMRIPGDDVMGFIVHTASHWVAVRRFTVPGHRRFCWYLVDSLKPKAEQLNEEKALRFILGHGKDPQLAFAIIRPTGLVNLYISERRLPGSVWNLWENFTTANPDYNNA